MEKFVVLTEITEEKIKKPLTIMSQEEVFAVIAATMLQTIMLHTQEVEFFAPLEVMETLEEIESKLESHTAPSAMMLIEVFAEMPLAFTSFAIPSTKLVKAFLQVIEEEMAA